MIFDVYCCDTGVAAAPAPRRKKKTEICRSSTCISPWFLFRRWFNGGASRRSSNRFMERKWEKEKSEIVKCSINHEPSSSSSVYVSAEASKEASLNLGLGFALIYLAATSRNELNKMEELEKKIEFLLHNFQTELQNHEDKQLSMPSKSRISSPSPNNGVHETLNAEKYDSGKYLSSDDTKCSGIGFGSYRREKSLRMDQIEAELEAEFGRLQLQMDEEFCLNYSEQQCAEINVEDSAPEESQSTSFDEVANDQHHESNKQHGYCYEQREYAYDEFNGVHPRELERRLHELLEERQQQRITELESALEYAIQQLKQKEAEVSWLKDTVSLVSQHFPDIPHLLRHVRQQHRIHGARTSI